MADSVKVLQDRIRTLLVESGELRKQLYRQDLNAEKIASMSDGTLCTELEKSLNRAYLIGYYLRSRIGDFELYIGDDGGGSNDEEFVERLGRVREASILHEADPRFGKDEL